MAIFLALLLTLVLGALADVATGGVRRLFRTPGPWWRGVARAWSDARLLVRDRDRASVLEAAGAGAALVGATLAAAAAAGLLPSSAAFLYLALALAATGGHVAASTSPVEAGEGRAARARFLAILAEPAFVLALGVAFLRWRASDLEAIRGAHEVLGPGYRVGPGMAAAGLVLAALALVAAGALRQAPEPGEEAGSEGGPALLVTLCRWSLAGATALTAAALLAGRGLGPAAADWPLRAEAAPLLGLAAAGAVVAGLARAGLFALPERRRWLAAPATLVLALAALILVAAA